MSSISETNSSSYISDPELSVDNLDAKLKLCGGIVSTFTNDGFWRHKFDKKNANLQVLSNRRAKMMKLIQENEKLQQKFDILFDLAKSTSTEYDETKEELRQLRNLWKQVKANAK